MCGGSRRSMSSIDPSRRSATAPQRPERRQGCAWSCRHRDQLRCPNKIVGGSNKAKDPFDLGQSAQLGLALPPDGLYPTERLLDPLAGPLARDVAGMTRGPFVDCRASAACVLRDMRAHLDRAQFLDEVGSIVALVAAKRDCARPVGKTLNHVERGQSLGMARDACQTCIDDQTRAVLHQRMADEAQLRLHPRPLTVKPGIRVGRAPMGLVAALLTLEIHRGVALATLAVAAAFRRLFRPEALH